MVHLVKPGYLGSWQAFKALYLITKINNIRQKIWRGNRPVYIERRVEEIVGYRNLNALTERLNEIIIIRQLQYNYQINQKIF